jgi:very-short-patch-repair endonuclease
MLEKAPNLSGQAMAYVESLYLTPESPLHNMERESGSGVEGEKDGVKPWGQDTTRILWEKLKPLAREMRQEPTPAEDYLWQHIRNREIGGAKFRRQHAIDRFVVDFYCAEAQLVIEVDGEIHQYTLEEDTIRQEYLESLGLRVLRFTNDLVLNQIDMVLDQIRSILSPPLDVMERGLGGEVDTQILLFYHAIAIMHAPTYRTENAGALRQDWPRIPLPATKEALIASAELGRQIAALLDTEQAVNGVTSGKIRDELKNIGLFKRVGGGPLKPISDLRVQAKWGYLQRGAVMPGQGTIKMRVPGEGESTALGERTCDVYLNEQACWTNIPERVWDYTIGGYQVIKKWLSYRAYGVLGRALTLDEARELKNIAWRIAAILLLEPALDANYAAVKVATVKLGG